MTRDQRTARAFTKGLLSITVVTLLVLAFSLLAHRLNNDFSHGLTVGGLTGLILVLLGTFVRLYLTMDEYGQRLHQRAGSLAFVITMTAVALTYTFQSALHFTCPLWIIYAFGMTTWGLCVALLSARDARSA
ncbi:hypothetical protein [Deinococcus maricopensis]|uniref:Uncharacterized protein n=1 Tax=Deinococcus maricopensis (strain DSM 21211 / LMG 22137 / NRRL B-23946 / LB-34) TaxID=709986 RepID=E8U878_DEIML|nr:hypothetical protein [Deinococcus maricopensis]ADV67267.1 hypothetical protein Deima_1618 [Deinococcus maricopensis DSM 21211]